MRTFDKGDPMYDTAMRIKAKVDDFNKKALVVTPLLAAAFLGLYYISFQLLAGDKVLLSAEGVLLAAGFTIWKVKEDKGY